MAAVRLISLHASKGRSVAKCLGDRTDYAKNPEKTQKHDVVAHQIRQSFKPGEVTAAEANRRYPG